MISERLLRKWRKEALHEYETKDTVRNGDNFIVAMQEYMTVLNERILKLTQELLDQHLLKK